MMCPAPPLSHPAGSIVSVLVIDDDLDIREVVSEILRDEGFSVESAQHGAEALELLTTITPRLILLDLNMPVMSGKEFRLAQRRDPVLAKIPTVVMTAADRMGEQVAELEPDDALAKPIKLPELLATVRRYAQVNEGSL